MLAAHGQCPPFDLPNPKRTETPNEQAQAMAIGPTAPLERNPSLYSSPRKLPEKTLFPRLRGVSQHAVQGRQIGYGHVQLCPLYMRAHTVSTV